jgi:CBS domain-containing protein
MSICPYCEHKNIEGTDVCESCEHSLSDLHLPVPASSVEQALLIDRITDLKPKTPVTVEASTSLGDTLRTLVEKKIGSVLVVDEGELVGIFSERDALMRVGESASEFSDRPIRELMTPNPRTLLADAKVAFAVRTMDVGGHRHVPIVNGEGEADGMVSVRDIFRFLSEKMSASA